MFPRVAFIDDEKCILESVKILFKEDPYDLYVYQNPYEALDEIGEK